MKKNVGFVIVFFFIIYGLIQLHYCSLAEDKEVNTTFFLDNATIEYSTELKNGDNVPFAVLVDPEYKKLLPENFDYEALKPDLILLSESFDEKDPKQISSFSNIFINTQSNDYDLDLEMADSNIDKTKTAIESNLRQTPYRIVKWLPIEKISVGKAQGIQLSFKQENSNNGKITNIVMTNIYQNEEKIELVLAASDEEYPQWKLYYDNIISSIIFDEE